VDDARQFPILAPRRASQLQWRHDVARLHVDTINDGSSCMIGIGDYTGSGFCLMDETETKLPEHASDLRMQETGAALSEINA
jgi:hypothetical protein